jgi:maltose/maltodextrin transport system substrate-binding protein
LPIGIYHYTSRPSNRHPVNILLRFAEDQFIIWEKPVPITVGKSNKPGYNSINWITPVVLEQYVYWMPVGRTAGVMVDTYWQAYAATKKEIYLAKAKAIANTFTLVQKEFNGNYPSYFTKYPMDHWLNSTVYPAKVLMDLENNLKELKK